MIAVERTGCGKQIPLRLRRSFASILDTSQQGRRNCFGEGEAEPHLDEESRPWVTCSNVLGPFLCNGLGIQIKGSGDTPHGR
jgi:hypothetical protein